MLRLSTTGMTAKNVMLWSWDCGDHPEHWWWELQAPQGGESFSHQPSSIVSFMVVVRVKSSMPDRLPSAGVAVAVIHVVQPGVLAFLCADLLLVLHNQGQSQFPILSFKVKAFPSFLYLSTGKRLSTGKLGPGQFGPGAQLSWAQFAWNLTNWNQASLSFPGKAPLLRNLKAFSRCLSV